MDPVNKKGREADIKPKGAGSPLVSLYLVITLPLTAPISEHMRNEESESVHTSHYLFGFMCVLVENKAVRLFGLPSVFG